MGEESIECNEGKLITKNGGYSPVKQLENGDLVRNDSQKKIGELLFFREVRELMITRIYIGIWGYSKLTLKMITIYWAHMSDGWIVTK